MRLISAALCLSVLGCGGPTEIEADACAETPAPTWEDVDPILSRWCLGCHAEALDQGQRSGAPLGVDFDTVEGLQAYWDDVLGRIESDHPPGIIDGISEEERDRLAAYLTCSGDRPSQ